MPPAMAGERRAAKVFFQDAALHDPKVWIEFDETGGGSTCGQRLPHGPMLLVIRYGRPIVEYK